jgi:DNA-binding HxlR family transcriptional regulator
MDDVVELVGEQITYLELIPCKSHDMLQRLGEKWTYLAITMLARMEGDWMRASIIKTNIRGISQRMLTVTLRNLERDGMVARRVHAEMPPRVEYALTPLGLSMLPTLKGFTEWIDAHWETIEGARKDYDLMSQ